jgi:hypothetical protein
MNGVEMEKVIGGIVAVVGVVAFLIALAVWPVMVALGVLHSYWSGVPAFGFFATLILLVGAGFASVVVLPGSRSSS